MRVSDFAADVLLGPFGMTHMDLPSRPDEYSPNPNHVGEYELFNKATEEVEAVVVMTAAQAKKSNDELRADRDDRRWIPFLEVA